MLSAGNLQGGILVVGYCLAGIPLQQATKTQEKLPKNRRFYPGCCLDTLVVSYLGPLRANGSREATFSQKKTTGIVHWEAPGACADPWGGEKPQKSYAFSVFWPFLAHQMHIKYKETTGKTTKKQAALPRMLPRHPGRFLSGASSCEWL